MSKKGGFGKFLGGLAIGAGLGLLLSPDTGENNRKALARKIEELTKRIKEVDIDEVKDELLYKAEMLQAELANLDKETAKEKVLDKANDIKLKAEELYKLAIEKGTPVVERAADNVRKQAIKFLKESQKKLENKGK